MFTFDLMTYVRAFVDNGSLFLLAFVSIGVWIGVSRLDKIMKCILLVTGIMLVLHFMFGII